MTSTNDNQNTTYLTLDEAAERLACSRRHLERLLALGRIPSVRVGRLVRIDMEALVASLRVPNSVGGGPMTTAGERDQGVSRA